MHKRLTIISHTEHYKTSDGNIVGLGSTVTEINHLIEVFDEIVHVAMLHNCSPPPSALPYISNKITFVALPALGGQKISDKIAIVIKAFTVLKTVKTTINKTDYFQFRAPTGIGVFVIPYLILFSSKKGCFKYAGNWKQKNAPLAYSFQRWLLKQQKRKVTINGVWSNQPKHCITFENPCLTIEEVKQGQIIIKNKRIDNNAIQFCFVGRLEEQKGVDLLIEAFTKLTEAEKTNIKAIHIVGDGKSKQKYMKMVLNSGLPFIFHGFLSRHDVHNIYKDCHAIVLPSASEGFPKVIAEAMNYGCLPIVSNISSIGHYVQSGCNGFLLDTIAVDSLIISIRDVLNLKHLVFSQMIQNQNEKPNKFTYSYYNNRIKTMLNTI